MKKIINKVKRLVKRILGLKIDDREMTMVEWLRICGAEIGENVDLINCNCNPKDATCLQIGDNVTCSYTMFLTHDASPRKFLGNNCNKIGRVVIGNNVFIGVQSVILPNVKIGNNVIIGAGSIVSRNIPDNSVAVGNPAQVVCSCDEYIAKHKKNMEDKNNVYWNIKRLDLTAKERMKFNQEIDQKIVYLLDSNQPAIEYQPLSSKN